jgi:hypothetical protein
MPHCVGERANQRESIDAAMRTKPPILRAQRCRNEIRGNFRQLTTAREPSLFCEQRAKRLSVPIEELRAGWRRIFHSEGNGVSLNAMPTRRFPQGLRSSAEGSICEFGLSLRAHVGSRSVISHYSAARASIFVVALRPKRSGR